MRTLPKNRSARGMTLLELTVVILVLLSLISILFIGARAWKKGSDRSGCVLNIRNAQQAVRSYQNLYQVPEGTTINMLTDLIGPGKFIASEPICPGGGDYDLIASIPPPGVLALTCSLVSSDDHAPASSGGW